MTNYHFTILLYIYCFMSLISLSHVVGSFVDINPTLNFIIYVPTTKQYPLHLHDEEGMFTHSSCLSFLYSPNPINLCKHETVGYNRQCHTVAQCVSGLSFCLVSSVFLLNILELILSNLTLCVDLLHT